ncbi:hypothetical protein XENOCAPTIV_015065 [Xenoophorus captivus]|uniref:Uncharacterized protein n=1 Tax=Xenoophorus captivus TaxID=1517983 RepID=A0ABV0QNB9_9TELE
MTCKHNCGFVEFYNSPKTYSVQNNDYKKRNHGNTFGNLKGVIHNKLHVKRLDSAIFPGITSPSYLHSQLDIFKRLTNGAIYSCKTKSDTDSFSFYFFKKKKKATLPHLMGWTCP